MKAHILIVKDDPSLSQLDKHVIIIESLLMI